MNIEGTRPPNLTDQQQENHSQTHSRSSSRKWLYNFTGGTNSLDSSILGHVRQMSQDILSRNQSSEGTLAENTQQEPFYKRIFKSANTDAARVRELFEKIERLLPIDCQAMTANYTNRYKSSIANNGRAKLVETRVQEHERVLYKTNIYISERVIEGIASYRKEDIKIKQAGTTAVHLSDIHWQQLREVLEKNNIDINKFKPEELRGIAITHKKTVNKLKRHIRRRETKIFNKDSQGYNALFTTTLGKAKVYFIERYFPELEITHVTIEKGPFKNAIAKITYHLAEKPKTAVALDKDNIFEE